MSPAPLKPAQHRKFAQLLRRLIDCGIPLKLPAYEPLIGSKVDQDVILGQRAPEYFLRTIMRLNERQCSTIDHILQPCLVILHVEFRSIT